MAPPLCEYTQNTGVVPHTRYKCAWTCSHPGRKRLATNGNNGMGRQDNDRTIGRVSKHLPSGAKRWLQWSPKGRVLWLDIAVTHKEEIMWVHDQMHKHEPCIAMVRIHQIVWTYYTGAAVRDEDHLTTSGEFCYDLMSDAFSFSSS